MAMFLYWALDPIELYKANSENKLDEFQAPYFEVLKEIEELLLAGHYSTGKIAFDPFKEKWRKRDREDIKYVPEELRKATVGEIEPDFHYQEAVFGES